MIQIREGNPDSDQSEKVFLILENHNEIPYDSYPVVIRPPDVKPLMYKATVLERKMKRW